MAAVRRSPFDEAAQREGLLTFSDVLSEARSVVRFPAIEDGPPS